MERKHVIAAAAVPIVLLLMIGHGPAQSALGWGPGDGFGGWK